MCINEICLIKIICNITVYAVISNSHLILIYFYGLRIASSRIFAISLALGLAFISNVYASFLALMIAWMAGSLLSSISGGRGIVFHSVAFLQFHSCLCFCYVGIATWSAKHSARFPNDKLHFVLIWIRFHPCTPLVSNNYTHSFVQNKTHGNTRFSQNPISWATIQAITARKGENVACK